MQERTIRGIILALAIVMIGLACKGAVAVAAFVMPPSRLGG